jgi:MFS family permease
LPPVLRWARLWQLAADNGLGPTVPDPILRKNLTLNALNGVLAMMSANLVGPFMGIFAVRIGASNVQVALLSSLPALMSLVAMIPGARFLDSRADRKGWTARFLLMHRAFYVVLAVIPFFDPSRQSTLLVAAVALMNLPGAVGNIGWQALISRVIPPERRAAAFATRNRLMNLAGAVTVVLAGQGIDLVQHPLGYQIAFGLGFLFALGELAILNRLELSPAPVQDPSARRLTGSHDRVADRARFIRYTAASVVFYLAWQTPWPLFTLYQVRVLEASNAWISLLSLVNTGGTLLGFGFWARQAQRRGHMWTLSASTAGLWVVPVIYAYSTNLATLAAFNLLIGAVFSGVALSLFNYLLEVTPEEYKTTYLAYYTSAVNLSGVVAPMVGVWLLGRLGFTNAFLLCAAFRVAASLLYRLLYVLDRRSDRVYADGNARACVSE